MRKYRIEDKEFSEINITPFTDVILVVLIIFMIASPFLITSAMKVNLPKASFPDNSQAGKIQIYMNSKDQVFLDSRSVNLDSLNSELKADFRKKNSRDVIVKADKDAVYGKVVYLFDIIKNAGAEKLLIAAVKK